MEKGEKFTICDLASVTHVTDMGDSGWMPLRPKIMVGALEKEEGGEVLPSERLIGGEGD